MPYDDNLLKVAKYGVPMPINNADLDPEVRITTLIEGATRSGLTVEDLELLHGKRGLEPCQSDEERRERTKALLGKVTYRGREYSPDEVPDMLARIDAGVRHDRLLRRRSGRLPARLLWP